MASELTDSPVLPLEAGEVCALDRLTSELAGWLTDVPRFRAFADAHRDKIRKKLRLAHDTDARADVRAELLVACRLLADRHVELAFEAGTGGGPDFAVTYRGGRPFNLEVTRPRRLTEATVGRPILAKLRQLPGGSANVLLLVLPEGDNSHPHVAATVRTIRARADAKDEEFFIRRRFAGTRDFYDRFLRLGAVVTWPEHGPAEAWLNRSARIPVPDRAMRACLDALGSP